MPAGSTVGATAVALNETFSMSFGPWLEEENLAGGISEVCQVQHDVAVKVQIVGRNKLRTLNTDSRSRAKLIAPLVPVRKLFIGPANGE